jgi:hypothetical protein
MSLGYFGPGISSFVRRGGRRLVGGGVGLYARVNPVPVKKKHTASALDRLSCASLSLVGLAGGLRVIRIQIPR